MVERPIKKADRIAPVESAVSSDSSTVVEPTSARKTVAPVLAKDRSNSTEPRAKAAPSRDHSNGNEDPKAKDRDRGRDRQKRGTGDAKQTVNQALARGPRPTKAKVEEPVEEIQPEETVEEIVQEEEVVAEE